MNRYLSYLALIISIAGVISLSSMVNAANPSTPILPSDNIQDPGASSTAWGGCGPTDSNCYVTVTGSQWTTSAGNIYFNTGNVGIGTNVPASKLDVVGNLNLRQSTDSTFSKINTYYGGLYLGGSASDTSYGIEVGTDVGGSPGTRLFSYNQAAIGFGTGTPYTDKFTFDQFGRMGVNMATFPTATNLLINGNAAIGYSTTGIAAPTNGLLVAGNVGIGTTSPSAQLHVAGKLPSSAVSSIATGTSPVMVGTQGNYAYVANYGSSTFKIYDVTRPESPVLISTQATDGSPRSIKVQGKYLYVLNDDVASFQIFDISNPKIPVSKSSTAIGGGYYPQVFDIKGSYAYVGRISGFLVIDISNPSSPSYIPNEVATAGVYVAAMAVQGRYVYTVGGTDYLTPRGGRLSIEDVSNPKAPTSVSNITIGDSPSAVTVEGRYAYVVTKGANKLEVYDISDPATIVAAGSLSLAGTTNDNHMFPYGKSVGSVSIQGKYAYVVNDVSNTVQVVDISNPNALTSVGTIATGGSPMSVVVQGRYVYVANFTGNTMQIFDVGGAYIQQLETGGIQTSSLSVKQNLSIGNDVDVTGGLSVFQGAKVSGEFSVSDSLMSGSSFVVHGDGQNNGNTPSINQVDLLGGYGAPKTISFAGFNLSNIATSTTASILKTGLQISSTGTWSGSGSTNVGLYISAVTGGTNNYDAIFNGGGNVGIGTATPAAKLDVNGSGIFRNGTNLNIFNPDTGFSVNNIVNDSYHTVYNGTVGGTNGGTGQIVIGGSVIANSNGSNFNTVIGYGANVTNSIYSMALGYGATVSAFDNSLALGRGAIATAANQIVLGRSSENVYVPGNMAIGPLPAFLYGRLNVNVASDQNFVFRSNPTTGARIEAVNDAVNVNIPMELVATRFSFAEGNVGIGTPNPTDALDITGNLSTAKQLVIHNNYAVGAEIYSHSAAGFRGPVLNFFRSQGTQASPTAVLADDTLGYLNFGGYNGAAYINTGHIQLNASENWTPSASGTSMSFLTTANGTNSEGTRMVILDNGNIGIGTSSPSYLLHVGSASVSGIVARFQNSTGTCDINPTTSSLSCSSDMTLKKNINTLTGTPWVLTTTTLPTTDSTLDKVIALTPVTYNWSNESGSDNAHIGFIAQDVRNIFPNLVAVDSTTHLLSVNYTGFIPYTVQAIKELNVKIIGINDLATTNNFRDSISAWLSNASNKVTRIFTGEICLTDSDGSSECINKTELRQLKQLLNTNQNTSGGGGQLTSPDEDQSTQSGDQSSEEESVLPVPESETPKE